jgi:hypothetical protein
VPKERILFTVARKQRSSSCEKFSPRAFFAGARLLGGFGGRVDPVLVLQTELFNAETGCGTNGATTTASTTSSSLSLDDAVVSSNVKLATMLGGASSLMVFGNTGKLLDDFWLPYRTRRETNPGISELVRQKIGGGLLKSEKEPRQLRN